MLLAKLAEDGEGEGDELLLRVGDKAADGVDDAEGEEEVDELLLNIGVDAADGVDDVDVQISGDTLGFTPIGVG